MEERSAPCANSPSAAAPRSASTLALGVVDRRFAVGLFGALWIAAVHFARDGVRRSLLLRLGHQLCGDRFFGTGMSTIGCEQREEASETYKK